MAKITQNHLNILFHPLRNYGLRGNSAFWDILNERLAEQEFEYSAAELLTWINTTLQELFVDGLLQELKSGNISYYHQNHYAHYQFPIDDYLTFYHNNDGSLPEDTEEKLTKFVKTLFEQGQATYQVEGTFECDGELEPPSDIDIVFYIEGLNRGGMSGGAFHMPTWLDDMLPELTRRAQDLEAGIQFRQTFDSNEQLFIGDVHGCYNKLQDFLTTVGWNEDDQEDPLLVFVGDLIDNDINEEVDHLALLNYVRDLVAKKRAICLLGNHEFNAIGWMLKNNNGDYCRPHSDKNREQHQGFLTQVGEGSEEHLAWIEWFKSLPLFANFGTFNAIHACWHQPSISKLKTYLNSDNSLKEEFWPCAFDPSHELFKIIEVLLKGPELKLPDGKSFIDRNGHKRDSIRIAWWKDAAATYRDLAIVSDNQRAFIPDLPLPRRAMDEYNPSYDGPIPVPTVIGHYTLSPSSYPSLLSRHVACVDFSAAKQGVPLVALCTWIDDEREEDEPILNEQDFLFKGKPESSSSVSRGIYSHIENGSNVYPPVIEHALFRDFVSQALLQDWDPIGVYDGPETDEEMLYEYSDYEENVMRLAQHADESAVAGYLALVQTHLIQMEVRDRGYTCARVADKVVTFWRDADQFGFF
ncbi:metallophosphoesterase [Vibrio agarivorans]|uniref:metallophosphoesterase n=1 Tax=Vibrio agarivorans TaxID=153622 RepID=UPI002230F03E|nr:metallophosphoesterase [Vibrio agarivorans]